MPPPFPRREAPPGRRYSPHEAPQDQTPSSTLLLRGLARSVNDEMILHALHPFQPLQARVIYDKATGDPRGFAFVDFESIESAMQAIDSFQSKPLVLQYRTVNVSYTDGFRRRPVDGDSNRWRGDSRQYDAQYQGERRVDWLCDESSFSTQCQVTNFARRTTCFQCNVPKPVHAREMINPAGFNHETFSRTHSFYSEKNDDTTQGAALREDGMNSRNRQVDNSRSGVPSQVLVLRMLPPDIEEGEVGLHVIATMLESLLILQVAFAEFDGVQDIRLIRDRATNLSRGFGFVEFRDIRAATNALRQCEGLVVHNTHVEVSFARDTLSTRSQHVTDLHPGPRAGSSLVVTALEQAQWSLSQGRGVDTTIVDQHDTVVDVVDALLDQAAAAVVPRIEEPKKMWPMPFETAGGRYVFVSEYGLYWDPDSLFYYDAQTMVYHNSFTGTYYRCIDPESSGAAAFQVLMPPLPVDEEAYTEHVVLKETATIKPALSLSMKKEKKKAVGISLAIKSTAFSSVSSMEKEGQGKLMESSVSGKSSTAASGTSTGIKRKRADDIAKWSQRQRDAKRQEGRNSTPAAAPQSIVSEVQAAGSEHALSSVAAANAVDSVIDALTNVPQEVPICLLCRRKFGSLEMLRKHEKLSQLHLANVTKANENKQLLAAQYREHENEMKRDEAKKQRQDDVPLSHEQQWSASHSVSSLRLEEAPLPSIESGIGGRLLKMMGWKSGEGLGKYGTGITAPVEAAGQGGRSETAGIGIKAPLAASVDLSDVKSEKERRQRFARARYDAEKV
ncbi:hypothetical protein CCR75_006038 [Bremia lactucae]|uniref:RNA-binding protein n=1 Tax=Bremia lactucae TaxID=4779 RepID=A0A976FMD3_BRELC|nr:hypothetical protein CCR75_006038 [Bremia lactucae]